MPAQTADLNVSTTKALRPERLGNRSVYVFSVRRGEPEMLRLASGANDSEVARCRAAQVSHSP